MRKFDTGTLVRLVNSPWPEREGCIGLVIDPPADGTYPQPAPWERFISLPDDPFATFECVVGVKNLEYR